MNSRIVFKILFSALLINCAFSSLTYCDDGSECPETSTCCKTSKGYACCNSPKGVCCGDDYHCCNTNTKCNLNEKRCEIIKDDKLVGFEKLIELAPTSLIYKKGWNALYYNCVDDFKLIKSDLYILFKAIIYGNKESISKAKETFMKLISDGKLTGEDCIKFLKEVFEDKNISKDNDKFNNYE
jgi:hypothetical protein